MRFNEQWLPRLLQAPAVVAAFVVLVVVERRRPLRQPPDRPLRHNARNLALAALAAACVGVVQGPLVLPLTGLVERRRFGVLKLVRLPRAVELVLAVVLMDYTLYLWHRLTHESEFLWRFHAAHHTDLALSATTGIRFHFGELLLSMPFRAAQIVVIGVSPEAFSIWQTLTTMQILFHHSNVRLPVQLERWLSLVLVTPRMHGIHHSIVRRETDSNFSTIFAFFDRLHRTLRLNVPQDEVSIGIPAYRRSDEVTLWKTLALPFRRAFHRWTKPGQSTPTRTDESVRGDATLLAE
ncbi:hypothetical protein BH09MYX1_BH09MYX1_46990 [soil metagenome]